MPPCFEDIADDGALGMASELREFLESITPKTCPSCRSRWFSPDRGLPAWAGRTTPHALDKVAMNLEPPRGGGVPVCKDCRSNTRTRTAANHMNIGPSFDELNCLTDVEQMLVARAHPIVQVWAIRTGQSAYVGHVVNLQQKVVEFFSNLPPNPKDLPTLLIRRPTREEWEKSARRSPLVVNRHRLEAAFRRLMESHCEYRGDKRPCIDNLDLYYGKAGDGDVELDATEREAPGRDDAFADRDIFRNWIRSDSFECARALARWILGREAVNGPIHMGRCPNGNRAMICRRKPLPSGSKRARSIRGRSVLAFKTLPESGHC